MKKVGLVLLALVAFAAVAHGADRRLLEDHKDDKDHKHDDKKEKKTVSGWKQCGGTNGCGKDKGKQCDGEEWEGYECENGYKCDRQNDWYWQCTPEEDTKSSSKTTSAPRELKDNEIGRYQQCGGSSGACDKYGCLDCAFTGKVCEPGYKCNRMSASYWQCDKEDKVKGDVKYCKAPPKLVKVWDEPEDYDIEDLLENQKKEEPKKEDKKEDDEDDKKEIDVVYVKKDEEKKDEKEDEEKEEQEQPEKEMPTFDEGAGISDILGEKAAGVKRCNEAVLEHEIDGIYMGGIFMEPTTDMYGACCDACLKEAGCEGFQINLYANATNTCEMFEKVNDVTPSEGVTAGVILLPNEVSVAGK